ncbi:MAG: phosphoribosyl-AMP cyclohydrolase [Proteobacteria bacterium]|nr:phosphoribosyl-AMP cyclohydrolase [Pseudomonadota bacterium]
MFKSLESERAGQTRDLTDVLDAIPFDQQGLIPAIAQDIDSGTVLMLAWMDRVAVERTLREGRVCYFSRSRNQHWQKGETSGHIQDLVELRLDCDGDAILVKVRQRGPACHTNRESCFYLLADQDQIRVTTDPV